MEHMSATDLDVKRPSLMARLTSALRLTGFWLSLGGTMAYCLFGIVYIVQFIVGIPARAEWLALFSLVVVLGLAMLILSNVTNAIAENAERRARLAMAPDYSADVFKRPKHRRFQPKAKTRPAFERTLAVAVKCLDCLVATYLKHRVIHSTREALDQLSNEVERFLTAQNKDEYLRLANHLLREAEQSEIVSTYMVNNVRKHSAWVFVDDLFRKNPNAWEWMSEHISRNSGWQPVSVTDEIELIGAIGR